MKTDNRLFDNLKEGRTSVTPGTARSTSATRSARAGSLRAEDSLCVGAREIRAG